MRPALRERCPSLGRNGDGLHAWKQTSAGRTYFLYSGSQPVVELNADGTALQAANTFGANGLLSSNVGGASTLYSFDPQGNVWQRFNSGVQVPSSDRYAGCEPGSGQASEPQPWALAGATRSRGFGVIRPPWPTPKPRERVTPAISSPLEERDCPNLPLHLGTTPNDYGRAIRPRPAHLSPGFCRTGSAAGETPQARGAD